MGISVGFSASGHSSMAPGSLAATGRTTVPASANTAIRMVSRAKRGLGKDGTARRNKQSDRSRLTFREAAPVQPRLPPTHETAAVDNDRVMADGAAGR